MTYSHHAFLGTRTVEIRIFSFAKIEFLQTVILEEMNFAQFMPTTKV